MKKIKTAVIMAGGAGSRRYPITKFIDKAMLPIGNRPTIDYVIEECVSSHITNLVIVIASDDSLIRKYYGDGFQVEQMYPGLGIYGRICCQYVVQDIERYGYGTAPALACVQSLVGDEHFVVLPADGFIYAPEQPALRQLIEAYNNSTAYTGGLLAGLVMKPADIKQFSLIEIDQDANLTALIEKPTSVDESINPLMANVSYYVLSKAIFEKLDQIPSHGNEKYLTDAVVALSASDSVKVIAVDGEYMDSGRVESWIAANRLILDL